MAATPIAFDAKTLADSKRAVSPVRSVHLDADSLRGMAAALDEIPDTRYPENDDDESFATPELRPPTAMAFQNEAGEDDFLESRDLREMGYILIDRYGEISHLSDVTITYLWKREGGKKNGKLQLGQCKKVSGLEKWYAKSDFIIWLASDHAKTLDMSSRQLEALLYHELCHISFEETDDGEATMKIRPHDVEMFADEVKRYGLWTTDLESVQETFRQARIPFGSVAAGTTA